MTVYHEGRRPEWYTGMVYLPAMREGRGVYKIYTNAKLENESVFCSFGYRKEREEACEEAEKKKQRECGRAGAAALPYFFLRRLSASYFFLSPATMPSPGLRPSGCANRTLHRSRLGRHTLVHFLRLVKKRCAPPECEASNLLVYFLMFLQKRVQSGKFLSGMAGEVRFAVVGDDDVDKCILESIPKNTRKMTTMWLRVWTDYLKERRITCDLQSCTEQELANILARFYAEVRTKNGEVYRRSSLLALRAALQRHISFEAKRTDVNLVTGSQFRKANQLLDAVLKENKREGKEPVVKHKPPISTGDLKKLDEYFLGVEDAADPVRLTYFCWFALTKHFALRGGEVQVSLKKSDVVFERGEDGQEYATLGTSYLTKNHPGGTANSGNLDSGAAGRIQDLVQVKALKKLIEKCNPSVDRLFQRALTRKLNDSDKTWFANSPLGRNTLEVMMPRISEAAGLLQRYTNHSVRATAICLLNEAGFEDREICAITGHKCADSLRAYNAPNEDKKRRMASVLDGASPPKVAKISDDPDMPKTEERPRKKVFQFRRTANDATRLGNVSFSGSRSVFNNLTINVMHANNADDGKVSVASSSCSALKIEERSKKFDLSRQARLARKARRRSATPNARKFKRITNENDLISDSD